MARTDEQPQGRAAPSSVVRRVDRFDCCAVNAIAHRVCERDRDLAESGCAEAVLVVGDRECSSDASDE